MLRRSRIASLVLVVLVLVGTPPAGSVGSPVAVGSQRGPYEGITPQVPDPYFPADGNPGFALQSYDLHVRYRFSDGYLRGTARMMTFPHEDRATFKLDLLLEVDSVTVFDNVDDEGVEAAFHKVNPHEVVVDHPLVNGDPDIVVVEYHGYPSRVDWRGESNWLANQHEVVTMNDLHMAPWWFPTNEHPSDPASFDIRVTTAKSKEVISNGEMVSRTVHGRLATTHWRVGGSMASHLAFFAAGDFDIEKGPSGHGFRYYNAVSQRLGDRVRAGSMARLRRTARITAWLQREVGDYPNGSVGGLVTSLRPGFSVANVTRPTYPAKPSVQTLVRELAHQWFGGRVRISQWADIWLNEGFATYMEWRYDEAHGGPSTRRMLHRAYRDFRDQPRFWDLTVTDPGPAHLFDRRVALRGAMTLAALRSRFGGSRFRELLQTWTRFRGGRHSSSEVFELFTEKEFDVQLDGFFDAWLRDSRPPPRQPRFGL